MKLKCLVNIFFLFSIFSYSQVFDHDREIIKEKNYFEVIKYDFLYNKIIIPVIINGNTYRFILDTGAPNVISSKVLKDLNLETTKTANITDANNLVQELETVEVSKIKIGNITFENQIALVYNLEEHNILSCFKIDGFIGSNLLKNSILKINHTQQEIIITDQINALNLKVEPSKIKLYGAQRAPFVELNFIDKNNKKVSDIVLLDTGMDGFYDMSNRAFNIIENLNIFKVKGKAEGFSSIGLFGSGKPSMQTLVFINEITLNNKTIKNSYVNTTDETNSSIGLEFLKYGNIIVDFINENFYFEANELINVDSKVPQFQTTLFDNKYIIGLVWDKNLKKQMTFGDEIISINSIIIKDLSFCEILKLGKEIKNWSKYNLTIKNKENKIITITIEN